MVNSVSPSYYAGIQSEKARFALSGEKLDVIPSGAIGIIATSNDAPMQYRENVGGFYELRIVEQSQSSLVVEHAEPHSSTQFYLGGIISRDRQTIYWVNNTKPLP